MPYTQNKTGAMRGLMVVLLLTGARLGVAQTTSPPPTSVPGAADAAAAAGTVLDRIVAVVNGDLVLESDVDEEQRFAAFQPLTEPSGNFSRTRAVERLINRDLILQQLKIQPQAPVTDKEVEAQLTQLRNDIPACKIDHCETEAGWQKFLSDHGFTEDEITERWKQRIEVLQYIEQRFRMGMRIPADEIKTYYNKTLLPQYAKQGVKAPKLEAVSDRIQEVLLQQQVSSLLSDWLKSLRAQGTVRVIGQDEASAE